MDTVVTSLGRYLGLERRRQGKGFFTFRSCCPVSHGEYFKNSLRCIFWLWLCSFVPFCNRCSRACPMHPLPHRRSAARLPLSAEALKPHRLSRPSPFWGPQLSCLPHRHTFHTREMSEFFKTLTLKRKHVPQTFTVPDARPHSGDPSLSLLLTFRLQKLLQRV